jgi:hypothetical protein
VNSLSIEQVAIDLGAYVDALGKSVLRIHNIEVQYLAGYQTSGQQTTVSWEVGTQSQPGGFLTLADRSIIASGNQTISSDSGTGQIIFMDDTYDVGPQSWTNGYLVAVEQIYLRSSANNVNPGNVIIVMECTVETLSSSAAMALALSQQ